jgi:outer membrane protein assembly factor BamA
MHRIFLKAACLPLLLALQPAIADRSGTSIDVPGGDVLHLPGDGGVNLEGADFEGGLLQRFAQGWPDDLVLAPVPGRSPQVGWSLALGGGYFLESKDEDSDVAPSILGGFAWYAENGSYAYGLGGNLHLLDDDLRVKFGAGYVDVRYRFYGIGNDQNDLGVSLDILQEAPLFFTSASYRVWRDLYVGLGYMIGTVETRPKIVFDPPPFSTFDSLLSLSLDTGAFIVPVQWDTRDHEQFPRRGWLMTARTVLYRESAGGDFDAESYMLSANHYRPVRERDVLAFRGYFRTTGGNAPFFILSTFGGQTDLRGYPSGRYRDKSMYALQGEYRWQATDRWIFTGFAGFGEVAPSFGDFGDEFLPAGGVGARFVLSQKHRVSLSADIAWGNDGAEFYFGVGEAF